jgi:hypothetical protein
MGYHSDDEPGLQNIVASLSMGTTCKMDFRPRQKPAKGFEFQDLGAFQALGAHSILTLQLAHVSTSPRLFPPLFHLASLQGDVVMMVGNVQLLYEV